MIKSLFPVQVAKLACTDCMKAMAKSATPRARKKRRMKRLFTAGNKQKKNADPLTMGQGVMVG